MTLCHPCIEKKIGALPVATHSAEAKAAFFGMRKGESLRALFGRCDKCGKDDHCYRGGKEARV